MKDKDIGYKVSEIKKHIKRIPILASLLVSLLLNTACKVPNPVALSNENRALLSQIETAEALEVKDDQNLSLTATPLVTPENYENIVKEVNPDILFATIKITYPVDQEGHVDSCNAVVLHEIKFPSKDENDNPKDYFVYIAVTANHCNPSKDIKIKNKDGSFNSFIRTVNQINTPSNTFALVIKWESLQISETGQIADGAIITILSVNQIAELRPLPINMQSCNNKKSSNYYGFGFSDLNTDKIISVPTGSKYLGTQIVDGNINLIRTYGISTKGNSGSGIYSYGVDGRFSLCALDVTKTLYETYLPETNFKTVLTNAIQRFK